MTRAGWVIGAAASWLVIGSAAALAQERDLTRVPPVSHDYRPAKTEWGEPDLRGVWPIDHLNFTPLQRTPAQGDRVFLTDEEYAQRVRQLNATAAGFANEEKSGKLGMGHWVEPGAPNRRTSLLIDPPDGRLPAMTAEGERMSAPMRSSYRRDQTFDWVTDFDTWDRCITRGMPASMFPFNYNNGIRIFQSPGVVAIQLEMVHETRIIPTDGRAPLPSGMRNWMGESRGHWEDGSTLVIETTNLKAGPSATNVGTWGSPVENDTPISPKARIEERLTMTGKDAMVYEVTYWDPVVFTRPWTARLDWKRNDGYKLFEYACHEGDEQVRDYITSSRAQRAKDRAKTEAAEAQAPSAP